MKRRTPKMEMKAVDEFNNRFPAGSLVTYWTGAREGAGSKAITRSPAELLSGHTAVVWLDGVRGCVALSHVKGEAKS